MKILILVATLPLAVAAPAAPAPGAPVRGIMDNSFLVEEAYNQEAGVVQHILSGVGSVNRSSGPDQRAWDLAFTQEWPLFSRTHQVSYTVLYGFVENGDQAADGLGPVLLNYRWQALFDEDTLIALAPRFSLVLPTGNAREGFSDDTLGYQVQLPFSAPLNDRWAVNANAGFTFLPDAGTGPTYDLMHYGLGASAIYAATDRLHLMLEWVGLWQESPNAGGGTHRELASVISPGIRHAFNYANDAQLVLGFAVPIGLNDAAPDVGLFLYVSFEHAFSRKDP